MEDQKEFTSYFWVSSSDAQKDYEKYVKDRNVHPDPPCGPWEEVKNSLIKEQVK